jgi:hypothetical protein
MFNGSGAARKSDERAHPDTALEVAPAEVTERRVYAAAAPFVTLLPPEGGVPGQCQVAPLTNRPKIKIFIPAFLYC